MKYTVSFFGMRFVANLPTFLAIVVLIFVAWTISAVGVFKFGNDILGYPWLTLIGMIILILEMKINDTKIAIVPYESARWIISHVFFYGGLLYFFFG